MTARHFNVLLTWDDDDKVWVTFVPSLGLISTFGETREEALANTKEAIIGYIEASEREGIEVPQNDSQAELTEVEVAAF